MRGRRPSGSKLGERGGLRCAYAPGVAETIRWGAPEPSVLLRVARRTGRLAEAGLAVVEDPDETGRYDVELTDLDAVLTRRYLEPRSPVTIIAAVDRGMGQALYAGRADLRGGTLGVSLGGDGDDFTAYAMVESLGLSRTGYRDRPVGPAPRRLGALQAAECDFALLNGVAGLRAEAAGFRAVARVGARPIPYLGSVLAAADPTVAKRTAEALIATAADICLGPSADQIVIDEAMSALEIPFPMAIRYLELLKSPAEGLVPDGHTDLAEIRTAVALRRRYGPPETADLFTPALSPNSGLIA
jgi:hypothetical protein